MFLLYLNFYETWNNKVQQFNDKRKFSNMRKKKQKTKTK